MGVNPAEVAAASLNGLVSALGLTVTRRATWLLHCRYSRSDHPRGPVYCPACLDEDTTPYFRLSWRLAFVADCPVHGSQMRDACPSCERGVWPVGSRAGSQVGTKRFGLCHFCGQDLVCDPVASAAQGSHLLKDVFDGKSAGVLGPRKATSPEIFAAVHALSQLFLRRNSRAKLQRVDGEWSRAVRDGVVTTGKRLVSAPLETRRLVVELSVDLLKSWPASFLDFADRSGISQEHFSGAEALAPSWMRRVVNNSLRKQNRGVTVDHVRTMVATMAANGQPVTKARVVAALHSEGQAVVAVMSLRQKATSEELLKIISSAPRQSCRWGATQQIAECRNRLVFIRAVLARKTLREVSALTPRTFWRTGTPLSGSLCEDRLRHEFRRCAREYQRLLHLKGLAGAARLHVARNGSAARRAQAWMSRAMRDLDSRLSRSVNVFYSSM